MYRAVDIMGFAGGFTTGMVQAGFSLVGKRELYGGFGVASCEANRHILGNDWKAETLPRNATSTEAWSTVDADVVFGNPPCSGFSVMSNHEFRGADSPINACMWRLIEYAARVRPQIVVFESVQMARTRSDGLGLMRQLRAKLEDLTDESWTLYHVRHNARFVGGVAERRRYFWIASRIPFGVDPDTLTNGNIILNDAIGDLINLEMSWDAQPYNREPSPWVNQHVVSTQGVVDGHITRDTPLAQRCVDLTHGVAWHPDEHLAIVARRYWDAYAKLPDSWKYTEEKVVKSDFQLGYTTPTRWNGNRPSRVVTGAAMCCAMHPQLDRMLTHRETARIMGFPDDWKIAPLRHHPGLTMTWGKGITVQCGKWIGTALQHALNGLPDLYHGECIGDREFDINFTDGRKSVATRDRVTRVAKITLGVTRMNDTEVSTTETPTTEAADTGTTAHRRQGRPRPSETITRDEQVYDWMTAQDGAKTRTEIAEGTELGANFVYLSLYRLRRDGRIKREHATGAHRWSVCTPMITEQPDPSV
jgi:site-specific DNA-cytosine methylase